MTELRVLHVGPRPPVGGVVNGIDTAVWPLLTAQAAQKTEITLLVGGSVEEQVRDIAAANHVELAVVPTVARHFSFLAVSAMLQVLRPDVVHFHSVFVPAHAALALQLRRHRIPYCVSPHGGLNLWRGQLKKAAYGAVVEKPYLRRADTIFVLTAREQAVLDGWLGADNRRYVELPNAVPAGQPSPRWQRPQQAKLVYLGRFDVYKKGLDRLVEVARLLPDVEVSAYGLASGSERRDFQSLLSKGVPANMHFLEPIYGGEKIAALLSASMYVQLSRDEGFGMSIVEAMQLGVPVAISSGCAIADRLAEEDLGLILPDDPAQAAVVIKAALGDDARVSKWSRSGSQWTTRTLASNVIAQQALNVYRAAADRAGQ